MCAVYNHECSGMKSVLRNIAFRSFRLTVIKKRNYSSGTLRAFVEFQLSSKTVVLENHMYI